MSVQNNSTVLVYVRTEVQRQHQLVPRHDGAEHLPVYYCKLLRSNYLT